MTRLAGCLTFALLLVAPFSTGQSADSGPSKSEWKEFSFEADGFAIRLPQAPKQTGVIDGTQYRLYWNESWDADKAIVLNLIVNRGSADCAAWLTDLRNVLNHPPHPPGGLPVDVEHSAHEVTIDGSPAIVSEANRNAMQAGYQRNQCLNGRVYHFEAGFPKGSGRPEIVDQMLSSFRVIAADAKK